MRLVEMTWNEDEEKFEEDDDESVGDVDWKAYADTILEIVDEQLAAFNLEVVEYETGGDSFVWRIEKRAAPGGDSLAAKLRRLDGERAHRTMVEDYGWTFLDDNKRERAQYGRENAKRKAVARAAILFLRLHLGDRFDEFAAL